MSEFKTKHEIIRQLMLLHQVDALLLQRISSFAWATCGAASYINTAATFGDASLLVTPGGRYLITNNIEATRLEKEEKLVVQGWDFQITPWHESQQVIANLTKGLKVGADNAYSGAKDLSSQVSAMRSVLLPEEEHRFRILGKLCAQAMEDAIAAVTPGQTEYEIAGLLANAAERRGVQAIVNLIATDERIYAYRHPLPTGKNFERYAMLVLCGRRGGLVCSITRLVHFGPLPDDLLRKQDAVARIDAEFILSTRPGVKMGEVFQNAVAMYAETGFADEWHNHHQGGTAAYEPREAVATLASQVEVELHQAYAWNPSVTGTKSEDTVLVGDDGNEVLTEIAGWPSISINRKGKVLERPAILVK
jgi:Xaa-Pro aminopeptidase